MTKELSSKVKLVKLSTKKRKTLMNDPRQPLGSSYCEKPLEMTRRAFSYNLAVLFAAARLPSLAFAEPDNEPSVSTISLRPQNGAGAFAAYLADTEHGVALRKEISIARIAAARANNNADLFIQHMRNLAEVAQPHEQADLEGEWTRLRAVEVDRITALIENTALSGAQFALERRSIEAKRKLGLPSLWWQSLNPDLQLSGFELQRSLYCESAALVAQLSHIKEGDKWVTALSPLLSCIVRADGETSEYIVGTAAGLVNLAARGKLDAEEAGQIVSTIQYLGTQKMSAQINAQNASTWRVCALACSMLAASTNDAKTRDLCETGAVIFSSYALCVELGCGPVGWVAAVVTVAAYFITKKSAGSAQVDPLYLYFVQLQKYVEQRFDRIEKLIGEVQISIRELEKAVKLQGAALQQQMGNIQKQIQAFNDDYAEAKWKDDSREFYEVLSQLAFIFAEGRSPGRVEFHANMLAIYRFYNKGRANVYVGQPGALLRTVDRVLLAERSFLTLAHESFLFLKGVPLENVGQYPVMCSPDVLLSSGNAVVDLSGLFPSHAEILKMDSFQQVKADAEELREFTNAFLAQGDDVGVLSRFKDAINHFLAVTAESINKAGFYFWTGSVLSSDGWNQRFLNYAKEHCFDDLRAFVISNEDGPNNGTDKVNLSKAIIVTLANWNENPIAVANAMGLINSRSVDVSMTVLFGNLGKPVNSYQVETFRAEFRHEKSLPDPKFSGVWISKIHYEYEGNRSSVTVIRSPHQEDNTGAQYLEFLSRAIREENAARFNSWKEMFINSVSLLPSRAIDQSTLEHDSKLTAASKVLFAFQESLETRGAFAEACNRGAIEMGSQLRAALHWKDEVGDRLGLLEMLAGSVQNTWTSAEWSTARQSCRGFLNVGSYDHVQNRIADDISLSDFEDAHMPLSAELSAHDAPRGGQRPALIKGNVLVLGYFAERLPRYAEEMFKKLAYPGVRSYPQLERMVSRLRAFDRPSIG